MDNIDIAWAAGFFDGEGCISLNRKANPSGGEYRWLRLQVAQSDRRPLERFQAICGGTIIPVRPNALSVKQKWQLYLYGYDEITRLMETLIPYLSEPKLEQWEAAKLGLGPRTRPRRTKKELAAALTI